MYGDVVVLAKGSWASILWCYLLSYALEIPISSKSTDILQYFDLRLLASLCSHSFELSCVSEKHNMEVLSVLLLRHNCPVN